MISMHALFTQFFWFILLFFILFCVCLFFGGQAVWLKFREIDFTEKILLYALIKLDYQSKEQRFNLLTTQPLSQHQNHHCTTTTTL